MITFTELVGSEGAVLYRTDNGVQSFVTTGRLSVMMALEGALMLLKMGTFEYGLEPRMEVNFEESGQFALIVYLKKYPQGNWTIKANEQTDALISCLQEKCFLRKKGTANINQPVSNQSPPILQSPNNLQQNQLQSTNVRPEQSIGSIPSQNAIRTEQSVVVQAAKGLGTGISFTGKLLSTGIESLGRFVSTQVDTRQPVAVSNSTKNALQTTANVTGRFLDFASTQVGNLFRFGKGVAQDVGKHVAATETGQQLAHNENLTTVKEGAEVGVKAFAHLYSGVVDAVYSVGSGVSKGTTAVVGKMYGNEAAQVADGVLTNVGAITKITRIPVDQAAKVFSEGTGSRS